MTDTPAWAYGVAYRRAYPNATVDEGLLKSSYESQDSAETALMRAFAAHIAATEKQPVDSLVLEARKIVAAVNREEHMPDYAYSVEAGENDGHLEMLITVAALKRGKELAA